MKFLKEYFLAVAKRVFRHFSFIRFHERHNFEPLKIIANILNTHHVSTDSPLRILDLGGGGGSYWHNSNLGKLRENNAVEIVLMDAAYDEHTTKQESSITKIHGIIPGSLSLVPTNSFDIVIALDLIEHLTKSDGCLLLYEMDRISSSIQIVFTPNGFVWQPPSENNPYNAHISGWEIKDFISFGFKKYFGAVGHKHFIGPYSQLRRVNPSRFHRELVAFSAILVRWFPKFASSIIYVKTNKDSSIRILNQEL
jgi:hypothetical protein